MSVGAIHLLFPMSGQGVRYQNAGYTEPKPLVPVGGKPMIERLLEQFPKDWPCTFVIAENHLQTPLPQLLKRLRPQGQIIVVPVHREGPGKALQAGLGAIPQDHRILVSYCDYGMIWDAQAFEKMTRETSCDAALISYIGFHAHYLSPVKYAYSRLEGDLVKEVREKGSFTEDREKEYASCGAYYFKNAKTLAKALDYQYEKQISLGGEFYTSLTVQALLEVEPSSQVRVFEIPYFFQWGTPEDLWDFEYWEATFGAAREKTLLQTDQILMPMAGLGSRFKSHTTVPKPFIPLDGKMIYQRALESLPKAAKNVFVALKEHQKYLKNQDSVRYLQATPAGQALSTEAGLSLLSNKKSVLVSACDHELYINPMLWADLMKQNPEAIIFTVKGFPGCRRSPNSYAYVEPVDSENPISAVKAVSVKVPLSPTPSKDQLLVGTFWFKSAELLGDSIQELKKRDARVNNELYLDSVFEGLLSKGKRVFLCETDGYVNWGDPLSMAEALYWQEVFVGPKRSKRTRWSGVFE